MTTAVGIDQICFYVPSLALNMADLARHRGVPVDKYRTGLGQETMAVLPPNEDIVTLGAAAAWKIVQRTDKRKIQWLFFATESAIDQSKAAGMHVHHLLGLSPACRVVEMKQACYGSTAALRLALSAVRDHPESQALVIAADVARYGLGSAGEPTQGCGAVAMLVTASPRLMTVDRHAGFVARDAMDFWRPPYRSEAFVDGHYSTKLYLTTLTEAWDHYAQTSGRQLLDHAHFCYHLPFTRMAAKAHSRLMQHVDVSSDNGESHTRHGALYNAHIGNAYTASLYISLCSLLDHAPESLHGQRVGLFSYGSGSMAEFFSGQVVDDYASVLFTADHQACLSQRQTIDIATYEKLYAFMPPVDDGTHVIPQVTHGPFSLIEIRDHKRVYRKSV